MPDRESLADRYARTVEQAMAALGDDEPVDDADRARRLAAARAIFENALTDFRTQFNLTRTQESDPT